eukprot:Pgem_evm1s3551
MITCYNIVNTPAPTSTHPYPTPIPHTHTHTPHPHPHSYALESSEGMFQRDTSQYTLKDEKDESLKTTCFLVQNPCYFFLSIVNFLPL